MMILLLTFIILFLCGACMIIMVKQLKTDTQAIRLSEKCKLFFSGIIAFIADTIGVGSFAVNIALAKLLNTFDDEELPAVNNGAQVLPGTLASLFFMKNVVVDYTTLFTLVFGTCIGGLIGGQIVSRLSPQAIRLAMVTCFTLILGLLLADQYQLLPIGGTLNTLSGLKLGLGFLGMLICGSLTCVGIGLFAMVQAVLFLLGVSPIVAFPIMMTAGAMQQPLTTLMFLQQKKIPIKRTLLLSLAGCIGVFIALPIVNNLSADHLHRLLMCIMVYNIIRIGQAFLKQRINHIPDQPALETPPA